MRMTRAQTQKSSHHHKRKADSIISIGGFILEMALFGVGFAYIATHIIGSQRIHPLYFDFISGDEHVVHEVLHKSADIDGYAHMFNLWDGSFERQRAQIDDVRDERKALIAKYESLREQFPQSRDLLYNLYVLYMQEEEYEKAQQYLRDARRHDPMIQ